MVILSPPAQLAAVAITAAGVMGIGWLIQLRTRNATLVDVLWSGGLGFSAVFISLTGAGDPARRVLVGVIVGVWSARLAAHLLSRGALRSPEDPRYAKLRAMFPARQAVTTLFVFETQALLMVLLSLPFALAAAAAAPAPAWSDLLAAGLWLVGLAGESAADGQLARFKRDPANAGAVCDRGLWRYSRHPNYFFEWLMWCSFGLLSLAHPMGWLGLAAPALMLLLVLKVSGIPPNESRALASRGELYRAYQRRTSAFVPWFPRSEP